MKRTPIFAAAAAALTVALPACAASASARTEAVRLVAEADAWGGFCVNWGLDQAAADAFLRANHAVIRGDHRAVYGFAHASAHAQGMAYHCAPAACNHALDGFGPYGRIVPGLLRQRSPGL
ncbi:hypothetical protein K9U39_03695 [Rhodoblastus acidophilus]|uniref:DUF4189 domain-containing protein n=1 Tax=Candidatus Rhodoblastus alkanivorans TaxID=2954117 RepID=A0ABS9Z501_9HYPH|nr:hypothetical protein [Candidatus Rhodoblastus alkanivorans]MCI4680257.1 hypothetical protein [Candidatus Rhodoblastus alkanivorans]MCI4682754.1 hypothetical protein [Candidatus Rhodoblastus alkanivorans]MDI4640061.1 hypothetical protein [Rhodoblastus acidophilus]